MRNNTDRIAWIILFLGLFLFFTSCANTCKIVKVSAPEAPKVLPVNVRNRSITGKDLDNAVTNHINVWKHVEELRRLGGFR